MGEPYPAEAGFPVNGLAEVTPFADQEAGTSPDMLNVFPFDSHGRLRGSCRPGLEKFCSAVVNGGSAVQNITHIGSSYVAPILGDGMGVTNGRVAAATPGFSFWSAAAGTETAVVSTRTYLISAFGADGKLYVIDFTPAGTTVYLNRYASTGGAAEYSVNIFTASAGPVNTDVLGIAIDEDTLYLWYLKVNNIGECIMRFKLSNGANRDSTTSGCLIRAEADATSIEKVFGGVGTAGWTVIPATAHSIMKVYQGRLAVAAAPIKDGSSPSCELVLYVIDTKTGIVDAIHDLGLDGSAAAADKGTLYDIEFGLDGFIYVLFKDLGAANIGYLRKITTAGEGVWEVQFPSPASITSISYNHKRNAIAVTGNNLLSTGASLILLDADAKGIVDYANPATRTTWDLVRCDKDGRYTMFYGASNRVARINADFTTLWEKTGGGTGPASTDQARASVNAFLNTGTDEQGSTRYLETIAIAGGVAKKITTTTATAITGGGSFSAGATTIFSVTFGTLAFFADGVNHYYYSSSENLVKPWATDVKYGALPADTNGGFPYIEIWNSRIIGFGLVDDPTNWYMSARGDPFDWKLAAGVAGGAISGRLSPAGLFPDRLVGVITYNDDLAVFGGDHSLYQMSLDPAVDARFDLVSGTVGLAPGRAWCLDGSGSAYFLGNSGGIYRLSLNSPPQRITNRSIDRKMSSIDLDNSVVHLTWDAALQGIHVFVRDVTSGQQKQYFYDFRTEGWFPYQFAVANYQPTCVAFWDEDSPLDRKILLGCADGYIRNFSTTSFDDDGTKVQKYFTLGPWQAKEFGNKSLMLLELDPVIGNASQIMLSVLTGVSTQDVIENGRSRLKKSVISPGVSISRPMIRSRALAFRFDCEYGDMELEGVRLLLEDVESL